MIPTISDDPLISQTLYPFAETRAVQDIRVGILTIREKWERINSLFPALSIPAISVPSNMVPSSAFVDLLSNGAISEDQFHGHASVRFLEFPWQIFAYNDWALRDDYKLITAKRHSLPIPESVQTIKSTSIFVEEGAQMEHCILNASTGPIYIGKNAEIMEGSIIRGPFSLGEGSVLKMGSRIYGATSIGPYCVAGGEIKNSVIFSNSNKAHDGYLGDSVIGEWCNIGAGTSNSNLKNTCSNVKVWNQRTKSFTEAGMKCGLLMGDYSRCAINTSFNTGTVVGIAANVFGDGLTPKFIADFSWGIAGEKYEFSKAIRDINNWKKLKNKELTEQEIQDLKAIFAHT